MKSVIVGLTKEGFFMFRYVGDVKSITSKRRFETRDIVKRLGAIPPVRVHIKNHPIDRPVTVFNAAAILRNDTLYVYARVILGYYMYVSAIALIRIPIHDLFNGAINTSHYPAEIVVYPSTKYDIWGTEDPRIVEINGKWYLIYTGRTVNYFNPVVRRERTLPVIAVSSNNDGRLWDKVGAIVLPKLLRSHLVSDKDAFIFKAGNGDYLVFHRPHLDDDTHYALVSKVSGLPEKGFEEIEVKDSVAVIETAPFEVKIGWGSPPIEVSPNKYLLLLHGVDVLAVGLDFCLEGLQSGDGSMVHLQETPHKTLKGTDTDFQQFLRSPVSRKLPTTP